MLTYVARKQWTGVCQELLSNDNLATVYHEHEFQLCTLAQSEQIEMMVSKAKIKGKATLIEAVLGAIHLEGGDDALGSAMKRLRLTPHPDLPDDSHVSTIRDQSTQFLHHIRDEVKVFLGRDEPRILDNFANERTRNSTQDASPNWKRLWPF